MTPLTPIQVIDLVVETYVKHPENRSTAPVNEGKYSCLYNGPEGKHCAFAMFVANPEVLHETERAPYQLEKKPVILKPEVAHITCPKFWGDVQCIHDGYIYNMEDYLALGFSNPRNRLFDEMKEEYIPDRVEKYVGWLKQKYANYNPQSIQPGE